VFLEATVSEYVIDDIYLTINSVDFSDHTRSAQVTSNGDTLDISAMGTAARVFLMGLLNGSLAVEFNDDQAVGSVDDILWAAHKARVAVPFAIRQVNGAISTSNPELQGEILVNNYVVGGAVGTAAAKSLTLQISGDITRDTTP
jgi:hypothetical protein